MEDANARLLSIDGSLGEGGGQILRTALALSVCLRRPFRIVNIRKQRKHPGLRAQHLAAVNAAAAIADAMVEGGQTGSLALTFRPGKLTPGDFHFTTGTAGSTTLVLQTVLPALLTATGPSRLVLEGGTHNPLAPPFDFLVRSFLPLVNRMGPHVEARLERPGFYPAGGGRLEVRITPVDRLRPLHLPARGALCEIDARALIAHLPEHIAERELAALGQALNLSEDHLERVRADTALGPGNAVMVAVRSAHVTEVFAGFGERGVPAETVANSVARQVKRYVRAGVSVGEYLADQLLIPLALAGGGSFETLRPSLHFRTNLEVIRRFLDVAVNVQALEADRWRVDVSSRR
jgi:RNA 3'-terminal phosphate cyclase (ATP)